MIMAIYLDGKVSERYQTEKDLARCEPFRQNEVFCIVQSDDVGTFNALIKKALKELQKKV